MNHNEIKVNMLGEFSINWCDNAIYDSDNRMRKIWLLVAYFIYRRNSRITQDSLFSLLWENDEKNSNPQGALKTMLYRTRTLLNNLNDNAGYDLILHKDGNYAWNNDIPLTLDVEVFEDLYRKGCCADNIEDKLSCYMSALDLYKGDFLSRLAMESWVIPISAYFHKLYLQIAEETLSILAAFNRSEEAVALCNQALKIEPYSENIYIALMRSQLALHDADAVVNTYETLSQMLYSNFGIMPSEEARALYREATRTSNKQAISLDTVRDQLRETGNDAGALFCDYDFFKILYRSQARALSRSGDTIHIALISLHSPKGKQLSPRSFDKAFGNLKEQIILNLRQGDIVSQCSTSQFIIMLPNANYENSCMVCGRIVRAFFRKYPHSPSEIHFNVLPLEPRNV